MSEQKRKLSDWYVPPDIVGHLGLFIIAGIGILGGMFLPLLNSARNDGDLTLFYFAFAMGLIGVALLGFARLPLYRERRFFTFGPGKLDHTHKRLYRWAYLFIGVCLLLLAMLVLALRSR
ncbi:MAG: hypothetical protein ABSD58_19795 [Verrucomicrobiia bacterium]|jgi:hypothetical protein